MLKAGADMEPKCVAEPASIDE